MMKFISEHIVAWSVLNKASAILYERITFESIVFRFVSIARGLPKNAKRACYERALDSFRARYYNEFMYSIENRSEECCRFIQTLTSFTIAGKFQKKNYIELFAELFSFYKGSVGGCYNGTPLLTGEEIPLTSSPDYHLRWQWDNVMAIRVAHGFGPGCCASCSKKCTTERKIGLYMCPAGSLPLCDTCDISFDLAEPYLKECVPLLLPAPSVELQEHLKDSLEVCQRLSTAPNRQDVIKDLRFGVLEHGKIIVSENVRLTASNKKLRADMANLEEQCKHVFANINEYRISIQNLNQSRYQLETNLNRREQQLRERNLECVELQNRLNESIRQQWEYYNKLMGV